MARAAIWLAGALLVGTAWLPLGADDLGWSQLLLVLLQLGAAAFMFWVLYGTGDRMEERDLSVRGGPFRWRIPLDAIVSVSPTRNPLSSPACSLDGLRVVHRAQRGERGLMIPPADKAGSSTLSHSAAHSSCAALMVSRSVARTLPSSKASPCGSC